MSEYVITVAVRNAEKYIRRSLDTAVQNHDRYRIIVSDDESTDGTGRIISEFVDDYPELDITVNTNETRIGTLANHHLMASMIDDDEIIVILDGDDQLYGTGVLGRLDLEYSLPETWLTYGSYGYDEISRGPGGTSDPDGRVGWRGIASQMHIHNREAMFVCSHLRTYKRWLFDRIRVKDLKMNGEWYGCIPDVVTMFTMIEMCGRDHARYIHDILYLYNAKNPYNEFKGPAQWPIGTEVLRKIKEEGIKEFGHNQILDYDRIDNAIAYFNSQEIYPLIRTEKEFPSW